MMTPEEALQRWPVDVYDDSTLGGALRSGVLEWWRIAYEMLESAGPDNEQVMEFLAASATIFQADTDRIQQILDKGRRETFKQIMGYELP